MKRLIMITLFAVARLQELAHLPSKFVIKNLTLTFQFTDFFYLVATCKVRVSEMQETADRLKKRVKGGANE